MWQQVCIYMSNVHALYYNYTMQSFVSIPVVELRTQGSRSRPRIQKKIRGQGKDQGHKCKCFPKKKCLSKKFSVDLQKKNYLEKHFSADLQNFNRAKNRAIFEYLRLRGQGLENVSSRTPPLVHTHALCCPIQFRAKLLIIAMFTALKQLDY